MTQYKTLNIKLLKGATEKFTSQKGGLLNFLSP